MNIISNESIKSIRPFNQIVNSFPTNKKKNKKFPFSYAPHNDLILYSEWDAECFMFLDVLTNYIYSKTYGAYNNSSCYSKRVQSKCMKSKEELLKFQTDSTNTYSYEIFDKSLQMMFPFLRKYNSTQLMNIISRAAKCQFTMEMPCRFFSTINRKMQIDLLDISIKKENIFNVEILQEHRTYQKNVKQRIYKLNFKSNLGLSFIQNTLSMNFQHVNTEIFKLSKTAQIIYRKFLLQKKVLKDFEIPLFYLKIVTSLQTENTTISRYTFDKCFDELKAYGFIKSYRTFGIGTNLSYFLN